MKRIEIVVKLVVVMLLTTGLVACFFSYNGQSSAIAAEKVTDTNVSIEPESEESLASNSNQDQNKSFNSNARWNLQLGR